MVKSPRRLILLAFLFPEIGLEGRCSIHMSYGRTRTYGLLLRAVHTLYTHLMATITKRARGWQVQVRRKGYAPVSKLFRTKALAERWSREVEDQMALGTWGKPQHDNLLLVQVLERYSREILPKKRQDLKKAQSRIRTIQSHAKDLEVQDLSVERLIEYVDERLEEVSWSTVLKELNQISSALQVARFVWEIQVDNGLVRDTKAALRLTRNLSVTGHRDRRLTEDEYRRLSGAQPALRRLLDFAIETGMRRGEIAAARKAHLRGDGTLLHIPETKIGVARTIPLSELAMEVIEELPDSLFNLSDEGISKKWIYWCKKKSISGLTFHDLRHEATSRLFELGLDISEVAVYTGHRSWSSLKRYTQLRPATVREKALRLRGARLDLAADPPEN